MQAAIFSSKDAEGSKTDGTKGYVEREYEKSIERYEREKE